MKTAVIWAALFVFDVGIWLFGAGSWRDLRDESARALKR